MLSKRLKELREERGLLQKDIAKELNITTSAYGYYETGQNQPDTEGLIKLANFYDVSVDYLIGRTNTRSIESYKNLSPETISEINNFIEFMKNKHKK